ncbi:MAG: N-acetylmuramoyl-L-alanine amidase [Treponema sp.]|nr:MAG: N-acetylmuramoyl-L-alanine amidase [Treponema sp.]
MKQKLKNKNYKFVFFLFIVFYPLFLSATGYSLFAEEKYTPAFDFAKKIRAEITWEPVSEIVVFTKGGHTASCKVGQSTVIFDRVKLEFAAAPIKKSGLLFLSSTMAGIIESYLFVENPEPEFKIGAILIDPGHGGKDPGAHGSYSKAGKKIKVYEKNIALTVGTDLCQMLKQTYPDKKILMTRKGDTYPTLGDRVEMANNIKLKPNEAIVFISIHVNASFNTKASGFEVWYLPRNYRRTLLEKGTVSNEILPILNSMMEEEFSMESILLAKNILEGLNMQIGEQSKNRGLKENAWFVVRNAKMPSVLIELGFVSNPVEIKLLDSPSYLKKSTVGIYNGLVKFISQFENYGF